MAHFSFRRGAALLGITVAVILIAVTLSVALPVANKEVIREKEDQLRFILGEFRRAGEKFQRCHGRLPESMEEMLKDADGRRFLRRRYLDPFTGKSDWQTEKSPDAFVVFSASQQLSLGGVPYSDFR